jgi:hypothetical protein
LIQDSEPLYHISVDGPVLSLATFYEGKGKRRSDTEKQIIYGTSSGVLGSMTVDNSGFKK